MKTFKKIIFSSYLTIDPPRNMLPPYLELAKGEPGHKPRSNPVTEFSEPLLTDPSYPAVSCFMAPVQT